jgi:aryl-alcohol dehydrogenase-like predicted oxidoreductase
MQTRPLGRTGLSVSPIGFGAWGIGGYVPGASYGKTDDAVSKAALRRAFANGMNFVDTAPAYGDGHSETLIGEVLADLPAADRDRIVVATKAGQTRFADPTDFSPAAIHASVAASLARLRRPAIDLLQLHNATPDLLRARPEILGALDDLRKAGTIRFWGLSMKSPAEAKAGIEEFGAAVVQANYNVIDHRAADCGLFDAAKAAGAGIIARTPLAFGFLTGAVAADAVFPEGDHRRSWPKERLALWAQAARDFVGDIAARENQTLAQIALRFCVSRAEIATTIPGMLTPDEADANAAAGEAGPLPQSDLDRIARDYKASAFA